MIRNSKSNLREIVKRITTASIVVLMILAIVAGSLIAPKHSSAAGLSYDIIEAGIGAAHAYVNQQVSNVQQGVQNQAGGKKTAAQSGDGCKSQLPMGVSPSLVNQKWKDGLTTICYSEYTVAYSAKTRTPLWSAEYLTRERIDSARTVTRQNTFHEETKISATARAMLKDYSRSGYDRGHMAPSGDASNPSSQNETFSLANIVPQEPNNNRYLWAGIESGTRNYAKMHGRLNVITGPLFVGENIAFLNGRVAVPTHLWKLVYDPSKKSGGVFLVQNIDTKEFSWKSIADFEIFSGYRFNLGTPSLLSMPTPKQHF